MENAFAAINKSGLVIDNSAEDPAHNYVGGRPPLDER